MSAMVQLSGQPTDDPLAALEALLTMVAEKAVQFSADQEVDADTVAAMKAAGSTARWSPCVSEATKKSRRFPAADRKHFGAGRFGGLGGQLRRVAHVSCLAAR
jgi:hypothetical protein